MQIGDHLVADLVHDLIVRSHTVVHYGIDPVHQKQGADHRKRDLPETLPCGAALNGSRLIHAAGNGLQTGKEDDDLDSRRNSHVIDPFHYLEHLFKGRNAYPGGHQYILDGPGDAGIPCILLNGGLHTGHQGIVVFHPQYDAGGKDHRQKEHRAHKGPSLELLVQDQCHEKAEYHDGQRVEEHLLGFFHQKSVEFRIDGKGPFIVSQPRKDLVKLSRAQLYVAEAHVQRFKKRLYHERKESHYERHNEQISGYGLPPLKAR